jgi:hypothetical protein
MGIWGDIIYEWLDDLLPMDAVEVVNDEVCFSIHSLLHHTAASTHYCVLAIFPLSFLEASHPCYTNTIIWKAKNISF